MQIQKENIRKNILDVARNQFLEKGYKAVSMRQIAALANIGVSNIYNYFENKDDILVAILSPLLSKIEYFLKNHNQDKSLTIDVFVNQKHQREMIETFLDLIMQYRAELNLLFFKCAGSSLENFHDEYTDKHTLLAIEYLNKMKVKYPQINNKISLFFIHTMSAWQMAIFGEVVSHDDLTNEDIEAFLSEYIEFSTAGWRKIMKA